MKIARIEDLHCDAGWRVFSFLKITTDDGLVGWSEYNESYGSYGLSGIIRKLGEGLIGQDPRPVERISSTLYAITRQAPGGMNAQAIAAIENALLDVKAKALGVPVYALFGGPVRDRLQLYWSHCGSYRLNHAAVMGVEPVRSLDDLVSLGRHVHERGFSALKTNIFRFDGKPPYMHQPGFTRGPGFPELNADARLLAAIRDELAAFRQGTGPDIGILLDLNFNFKTEGYVKVARAVEPYDLFWLEIDSYDPEGLAYIRSRASMPIASCESLFGRRQFRPYFENRAMDVAIVDVPWNGLLESIKIAAMAEPYEINCAPHNFYGHLSTLMSAHFCAAIPNFRVMEIDIDDVPWKDDLVSHPPVIENGQLVVPTRPGWGADVNEDAIKAHPVKA
ncbi:mandelate racemase/muconate lactonizing enzyme family protein [Reyranella sp. CPCC 100927]|uniref:mandelate racemase/muconate lactonizing enzyme family protein n=1 Tax=Reyranella sp. CPCC 100927 TaxID=2599616 RepID=UPI0011B44DC1|nr:mandelate racemase/muconate lactonizing enzyme family protein [Reyranella sp. CPCC 100927]TWT00337.1 mandelate racemase/muconate lactonizing enzyme family protein [Reyranella sp. CPCC 100927]